jgi:hypothetical protein
MPSDLVTEVPFDGTDAVGPLETKHLDSQLYRNAADASRVTATHWHIAWANGLGWGFDGMDGAILALVAPLLLKEFAIDLAAYRNGIQITGLISIIGLFAWPCPVDWSITPPLPAGPLLTSRFAGYSGPKARLVRGIGSRTCASACHRGEIPPRVDGVALFAKNFELGKVELSEQRLFVNARAFRRILGHFPVSSYRIDVGSISIHRERGCNADRPSVQHDTLPAKQRICRALQRPDHRPDAGAVPATACFLAPRWRRHDGGYAPAPPGNAPQRVCRAC